MWPVRCSSLYYSFLLILMLDIKSIYSAITNSNFNERIREYSVKEDHNNNTNVTTLIKQGKERYSNFLPIPNPVTLKAVTDNELSSSSYSRGLLHHTDYGVHDYQEQIPYGYDYHDTGNYGHHGFQHHPPGPFYVNYDDHHGGNYANHHGDNHGGHHIGHHYKHNGHDLAAKTLLWPIAGIALLGAAAALVTNPVLLQLGVVSGRRKRRDTEEITEPGDIDIRKWLNKQDNSKNKLINLDRKIPSTLYKIHSKSQRMSKVFVKQYTKNVTLRKPSTDKNNIPIRSKLIEKMNYIQIPLKVKPSV